MAPAKLYSLASNCSILDNYSFAAYPTKRKRPVNKIQRRKGNCALMLRNKKTFKNKHLQALIRILKLLAS